MTWFEDHILTPMSDRLPGARSLSWQELGWLWDAVFVLGAAGVGYGIGRWT